MAHPDGLHRPEPLSFETPAESINRSCNPNAVAQALEGGVAHRINDAYPTGQRVLQSLRKYLADRHPGTEHHQRRAYRSALHEAGRHLLAPVENHEIALPKAPDIGWLKLLYPDQERFLLPFTDLIGLNSAWQWRLRGLEIPLLRTKIHPYYGVYFPTRFDHLELFDEWLHEQPKLAQVIDVGVGAGVLTLLLLQHNAQAVHATDINPNALQSVRDELTRTGHAKRVQLEEADLLGCHPGDADLIVFNPPWLPGEAAGPLDLAIYYPEDLFERFFAQAHSKVAPDGRVVLLFSNLVGVLTPGTPHPVLDEIERGGRFRLAEKRTRAVKAGSKKTKRSTEHRKQELVELWVLEKV